jgi:hypothetical protein
MKEHEMGGTCGTQRNDKQKKKECSALVGESQGRDYVEDLKLGSRVILKWILKQ